MDKLHRRSQPDLMIALIATEFRRRQGENRAKPFAPRLDQMRGKLGNARRIFGSHAFPDHAIYGFKLRRNKRGKAREGILFRAIA